MKKFKLMTLSVLVMGAVVWGCSESISNEYGGPGSDLRLSLEGNSFTWTQAPTVAASNAGNFTATVTGTYEQLESGFLKLTVAESDSDGAEANAVRYAMEVPGFTTVMQPMLGAEGIEVVLNTGTCPADDLTLNWISPETDSPRNQSRDIWGTFSYSVADSQGLVLGGYSVDDGYPVDDEFNDGITLSGDCADGILSGTVGEETANLYLNPAGGAIVDTGVNTIIAMPSGDLTAAEMDGTYFGLALFSGDTNSSAVDGIQGEEGVQPVRATISGSGAAVSISKFADIEANTLAESALATFGDLTYNTTNDVSGSITATMTIDGDTANVVCLGANDAGGTGKNILYCHTYAPDYGNGTEENLGVGLGFLLREE